MPLIFLCAVSFVVHTLWYEGPVKNLSVLGTRFRLLAVVGQGPAVVVRVEGGQLSLDLRLLFWVWARSNMVPLLVLLVVVLRLLLLILLFVRLKIKRCCAVVGGLQGSLRLGRQLQRSESVESY